MPDNYSALTPLLGFKIEATPGTAETLVGADSKIKPYDDFAYSPAPNFFPSQEVSGDLGVSPGFMSGKKSGFSFGTHFRASGTVGTAPAIAPLLRGVGLKEETVNLISLTAPPTGDDSVFEEGAAYSATGGKTGTIERRIAGTLLYYIIGSGGALAAADVVTVGGDTATTTGSDAVYALRYRPILSGQETLTIERLLKNLTSTVGAVNRRNSIKGAMGNLVLTYAAHDIGRAAWDFMGVDNADDEVALWTSIVNESIAASLVGKLINATITLNTGGGAVGVNITQFSLDFGARIELAPEPGATDGGTAGYKLAAVEGREPILTIDPRAIPEASFDELLAFKDGTAIEFSFVSSGTAGHIIDIFLPAMQITGLTEGDVNNRKKWDGTFAVNTHTVEDHSIKLYLR